MTHIELITALAAIEQAFDDRVEVWREVVEPDGTVSQRIYRGSFQRSTYCTQKPRGNEHTSTDAGVWQTALPRRGRPAMTRQEDGT
jgi:hypothetical protein